MENILIECSQKESYTPDPAVLGDFKTIFKQPHYIYEGDEVAVSKVFIDNETSSDGIIVIENLTNISGSVILYNTNTNRQKIDVFTNTAQPVNDNLNYFLSGITKKTNPAYKSMIHVTTFVIYASEAKGGDWGDLTGGDRPLTIKYHDIAGNTRIFFLDVPKQNPNTGSEKEVFVDVDLYMQNDFIRADNTNGNYTFCKVSPLAYLKNNGQETGVQIYSSNTDIDMSTSSVSPVNFPFSFDIPAGKYIPEDLCTLINDKMTVNNVQPGFLQGQQLISPFLKTYTQATSDPTIQAQFPDGFLMVTSGFDPVARTNTMNGNYWLGTSTIDLQFDTSDNKFYWNQLHFPYFGKNDNGTPATQIFEQKLGTVAQGFINVSKNGGIVFSKFDAIQVITNADGSTTTDTFDFLSGVLGFRERDVIIQEKFVELFDSGEGAIFNAVQVLCDEQIHTTNVKPTIASSVDRNTDATFDYQFIPVLSTSDGYNAIIDSTINRVIKAKTSAVSGEILESGYFLVRMDCGFTNTIVSSNKISKNINAIVSRYYSLGSYTSTSLDPSMIYTHRGEPILLTEANITILNSDRTIANVGNDNTVFIEIVRGDFYKTMIAGNPDVPQKK
tara:strand:- start:171 stop:2009 length:1839 start_codon:yes stop_codon:yes gene_type:complete